MKAGTYWAIVVALILFGSLGIFSIGAPFLLLGVTLAVLSPWRTRRDVLATGMLVIVAFVVGYVLVAPLSCTATAISRLGEAQSEGTTICRNLLGIKYEGSGAYNPSLLPALLAGVGLSAIAGITTVLLQRKRPPPRPQTRSSEGPVTL
jgi:hypothetical protein